MRRTLTLALVGALTLAGCGGSGTPGAGGEEATLALDARPNATHVGIYVALAREYDDAEGVQLSIAKGAGTDFRIVPIDELATADQLVGVMAMLQRGRGEEWPPLLLAVERSKLRDDRDVVDATIAALRRGYEEALRDPELAAEIVGRDGPADRGTVLRDLRALGASFTNGRRFGELDRGRLERWARPRGVDVEEAFLLG
ncbi:MAG TPA: hypothetical protein VF587_11720 [Solirubrobacteraceae bacterium]